MNKNSTKKVNCLKCNKEIDVYDLNGNYISEYKSMALASKELDVSIGSLSQCCNGTKYCFKR